MKPKKFGLLKRKAKKEKGPKRKSLILLTLQELKKRCSSGNLSLLMIKRELLLLVALQNLKRDQRKTSKNSLKE